MRSSTAVYTLRLVISAILCVATYQARDPNVLVVGGLGISGEAVFLRTFNLTFSQYLTQTVGVRSGLKLAHSVD